MIGESSNLVLNVFYFCSDRYASVAATSILSILINNKSFHRIMIFIADDGISSEGKAKLLATVAGYDAEIAFIDLPHPSELLDFDFKDRYQVGHSYPRMCVSSLLPCSVDRVLCLDSDTFVFDDLAELWNIDLGDNILAGVSDCVNVEAYHKQFGLPDGGLYCNAGVFLVDLCKWREEGIEDSIKKVIEQKGGNVFFFEQTLMNYCCQGRISILPPRYNAYTLFYAFEYQNLMAWRRPLLFYSEQDVLEAKENPVIVHFTRNFYMMSHPWKEGSEHPLTSSYRKVMAKTPWGCELWQDEASLLSKFEHYALHMLPESFMCQIASFLYNFVRPKLWWKNE